MRRVATSNEFFEILDKIGNGKFVTIGYVTGANLDLPTISKKNPLTNRMKKYPDYSVLGSEEGGENEIGALVKISSYNMRYLNRNTVGKKYGEYKDSANAIRGEFGLDPIKNVESYKQGTNWSQNGPEMYNGKNSDLSSHSYNPQNIYGVTPKSVVYAVNKEGHIIKEFSENEIRDYFKARREIDGVAALKKMNVEDEKIKDYISKIKSLKFKYINFESSSILWIAATINGEKIVYINDRLSRAVDGIDIRPEDFRAIARKRYEIDLNSLHEMANKATNKRILRLTESELRNFITESVRRTLSEMDWRTAQHAADKAKAIADNGKVGTYEKRRKINQHNSLGEYAKELCDKQYGVDKIKQKDKEHRANHYGTDYEPSNGELRRLQRQSDDIYKFYSGRQEYKDGKWQDKLTKESKSINEEFKNNDGYTHFAVNKATNKIVNGWDYSDYDPSELRQFKHDYFTVDLIDYGLDPKQYKIVTDKFLRRNGIDPDMNENWSNS